MAKLAILGFGTVGSGVAEVLQRNAASVARRLGEPLEVKYICDLRDFGGHPCANLFVDNIDVILQDPEVKVVVETIGGVGAAYQFVQKALDSGRHVVTSNKEMVAQYGAELLAKAKQNGVCFLFEASVGGGTPIITPMHQSLAANTIHSVSGIINGTTNFMLTAMEREGMSFEAALKQAQDLGYAETVDPSDDVDGRDPGRKIAILASLAYGRHIYPQNVPMEGIRKVTTMDMQAAKELGCKVKLIAWAKKPRGKDLSIGVEPMLVPTDNQLAGVEDVFNAVMVEGDMLGDVVFYGKGAGKLPTASAVVADAIDAIKDGVRIHDSLFWSPAQPIDGYYADNGVYDRYIRLEPDSDHTALQNLPGAKAVPGQNAVVLSSLNGEQFAQTLDSLKKAGAKVALSMRIWNNES